MFPGESWSTKRGDKLQLKVFKLKDGKLQFAGIREVRSGDIIVEGETSMAETVHLRESKLEDVNAEILASLTGKEREAFKRGLRNVGQPDPERATLKQSFKRLGMSDQEAEIAAKGRAK